MAEQDPIQSEQEAEISQLAKRVTDIESLVAALNPRNLAGIRAKDLLQLTTANIFGDGSDG